MEDVPYVIASTMHLAPGEAAVGVVLVREEAMREADQDVALKRDHAGVVAHQGTTLDPWARLTTDGADEIEGDAVVGECAAANDWVGFKATNGPRCRAVAKEEAIFDNSPRVLEINRVVPAVGNRAAPKRCSAFNTDGPAPVASPIASKRTALDGAVLGPDGAASRLRVVALEGTVADHPGTKYCAASCPLHRAGAIALEDAVLDGGISEKTSTIGVTQSVSDCEAAEREAVAA